MKDVLDLIEEPFEPDAPDDLFVRRVMVAVGPRRKGRVRRPIVIGLVAAIAVTGGAVAAMMRDPVPVAKPAPRAEKLAPA